MTVEDIIRMLDNPATLSDALLEAAKLPFRGDDKVRFEQKRQRYIDGLSDHDRPIFVGEMRNFLLQNEGCSVSATDGEGLRSYTLDRENQWHYLGQGEFQR